MLALRDEALKAGDPEAPFNRYDIGKKIGLHPRGVDTICTLLLQANFIKKDNDKDVYITEQGYRLIDDLLSDK